jgi:tetratricopeptide (TPR) repeat protein
MPIDHPFPGLRPFEAEEEDLFFGREGQSEEILSRLRQFRFVAVVGVSGSGKSSLIRAGLLPYLHGGFLAHAGSRWRVAVLRPGGDPIKNLANELNDPSVLGQPTENADAAAQSAILLEVSLRRGGLGLIEAVRLARLPQDDQLLIVVDQFEELFRFVDTSDRPRRDGDAAAFVKLLLEASQQRELPIYVALTMRSDYIGDCARYSGLPEAVTKALYLIPRMTRDQRRAAIIEPVRVCGGAISPRLVHRLLNDVGDEPNQLPILQHALMRTWDHWKAHNGDVRSIDVDDYVAIGGMAEALSRHADEAYDGLSDDRYRTIAQRLFQALSEKGPDNREARRPTKVSTLARVIDAPMADVICVVEDFRPSGRSFLTPAQGTSLSEDSVIDISHESLISGWQRMRRWVDDEAESARIYRRLAETAALHANGKAGLLHDPELENFLAWKEKEHPNTEWGLRYHSGFDQAMAFLDQSRLAREVERRKRQLARHRRQFASAAVTAVIAIVAGVALWEWHNATVEAQQAQRAFSMATRIANTLVFDLAQDPKANEMPIALAKHSPSQREPNSPAYIMQTDAAPRVTALPHDLAIWLFNRAIQSYTQLIELNEDSESYNGRAAAYYDKGDFDHAIADYNQAILLNSTNGAAYYNRGLAYSALKDFEHAIADYGQAIALEPKFAASYYHSRGQAYTAKLEYDRAISDFNQSIELDPSYVDAYIDRGIAYHLTAKFDQAVSEFGQAITLDPKNVIAHIDRSVSYYSKGDLNNTIADLAQAITLDPKSISAYSTRGDAYLFNGDYDKAIADYDRMLDTADKPDDRERAYLRRGLAFTAKDNYEQAIADYTEATKIAPKDAVPLINLGLVFEGKSEHELAIADYNKAEELCRKDPNCSNDNKALIFKLRGDAFSAKGDYEQAIADDTQAVDVDPKNMGSYFARARIELYAGMLSEARSDLDQARELSPQYAYTALWLEIANKRSNLPSHLADAVTQIDMTKWPAPVIRLYLGSLTAAELLAAAQNADVKTMNGQVCEANFYTGELALLQGAKEEAAGLFERAAIDCPKDFIEWPAARAELKALGQSP